MTLETAFYTHSEFMRDALYGEHGYYTKEAKFQSAGVGSSSTSPGHFATYATRGDGLAFVIAHYFYYVFMEQISNKKRTLDSKLPFEVIELSGGNGDLALRVFTIIEYLAKQNIEQWPKLFELLHYTIYEISPMLVKIQNEKNKQFVELGKLTIKEKSALLIDEKEAAVIFSNEIFDNLLFDDIIINENNTLIKVCIPYIPANWKKNFIVKFPQESQQLEEDLAELKGFTSIPEVAKKVPINKTLFKLAQTGYKTDQNWQQFISQVSWETVWVPIQQFSTLNDEIMQSSHVQGFTKGVMQHVSVDTIRLVNALKKIECDLQIHFDYAVAHKDGSRNTPVLRYPGNCAYQFEWGVDFSTFADFGLVGRGLSTKEFFNDCVYSYQPLAFLLIKDNALQNLPHLQKKFPKIQADIKEFLLPGQEYKFLCFSPTLEVKVSSKRNHILIGTDKEESYPDFPLNPLRLGISLDRPFISDSNSQSGSLVPPADIDRVQKYIAYYLTDFLGIPDSQRDREREAEQRSELTKKGVEQHIAHFRPKPAMQNS